MNFTDIIVMGFLVLTDKASMMMTELGMYAQYLRLFTLQQFPFIRI
jgi:hypothetical protein